LPDHLHVMNLAVGILIVAAQLFWLGNGAWDFHTIQRSIELYNTVGTVDAVRNAVGEGFKAAVGPYTHEYAPEVIRITLDHFGAGLQ